MSARRKVAGARQETCPNCSLPVLAVERRKDGVVQYVHESKTLGHAGAFGAMVMVDGCRFDGNGKLTFAYKPGPAAAREAPVRTPAKSARFRFEVPASRAEDPAVVAQVDTANDYIERICCAYSKSAEAIIEVGRILNEAKANLHHGAFLVMVEEKLPFSRSWAFKLMKIAGDPRLADVAHAQHLPAKAETLYELTKLDDREWKAAEKRGLLRQDVQRKEIVAIRKPKVRPAHVPPAPTAPRVVVDAEPVDHEDGAQREPEQHEVGRPKGRMLPGKPRLERLTRGAATLSSTIYALEGIDLDSAQPDAAFIEIRDDLLRSSNSIRDFAMRLPCPKGDGHPDVEAVRQFTEDGEGRRA